MKIHFPSREKARSYAKAKSVPLKDAGKDSEAGKRWYCEVAIVKVDSPERIKLRKKVIVIINADKSQTEENIEKCFYNALDKWKDTKDNTSLSRHTAKAELQALFSK